MDMIRVSTVLIFDNCFCFLKKSNGFLLCPLCCMDTFLPAVETGAVAWTHLCAACLPLVDKVQKWQHGF